MNTPLPNEPAPDHLNHIEDRVIGNTRYQIFALAVASVVMAGCAQDGSEHAGAREGREAVEARGTPVLEVAGYFDDQDLYLWLRFPTEDPSWYHQYLVYEDGAWIRYGSGSDGPDPHGLYEDRISMMWGDGSVRNFAQAGGYVTVHQGMRSTRSEVDPDQVREHPHLGGELGRSDVRKFLRESRDEGSGQPLWASVRPPEELMALREEGRFLDLWQWRAHRSNPIGYADNGYVLDYRHSSKGRSMYTDNVDAETGLPAMMFDLERTGIHALRLEKLVAGEYGQGDFYYLAESFAVPFDPDHAWEEGDTLPHRLLREPDGSRGAIRAEGRYADRAWRVLLRRSLQSPDPLDSLTFVPGATYDAAFAVHTGSTGSHHHLVSIPVTIGLDAEARIRLPRVDSGERPSPDQLDWHAIELFEPGDPTFAADR